MYWGSIRPRRSRRTSPTTLNCCRRACACCVPAEVRRCSMLLYAACRDKLANASTGNYATRRAIILLSDGEDNQSRVTREEAVEMAQRAEVIIYAISHEHHGNQIQGRQDTGALRGSDRRTPVYAIQVAGRGGRLHRNSGRVAQPVRDSLQAGRFCRGRALPVDCY